MAPYDYPIGFGQEAEDAALKAQIDAIERAAYPQPVQHPSMPQPVAGSHRIGPFNLSGSGLDSATLAVLQSLQDMPPPRSFAGGLAAGLAQGFAGARGREISQRQQKYATAEKSAQEQEEERRRFRGEAAQSLARWRYDPSRIAASSQTFRLTKKEAEAMGEGYDTATLYPGAIKGEAMQRSRPSRERDPDLAYSTQLLNKEREDRAREREAQMADEEAAVDEAAQGIVEFKLDPNQMLTGRDMKFRTKLSNAVNRKFAETKQPYNLRTAQQLRTEADRFSRVMNTARPTQLRQSAVTAYEHLKQMEDFYNTYWPQAEKAMNSGAFGAVSRLIPRELRESNKAVLWMAQNGYMGPQAAEDAAALTATGDPVRREVESVFSSGYAPFEQEIKQGFKKLDEARGPRGFAGQMRAMRGLIKKRVEVATRALPFYGGENNPYLIGVSPIGAWLEKEKEEEAPSTTKMPVAKPEKAEPAGGKAAKYR